MNDASKTNKAADDAFFAYIILAVAVIVIGAFVAYKYQVAIIAGWKVFILPLAKIIAWVAGSWLGLFFNPILHTTSVQASSLVQFLLSTPANQMSWGFFMSANAFIGKYLLIVFVPVVLFQTIKHLRSTAGLLEPCRRFRNTQEMQAYAASLEYKSILSKIDCVPITDPDYGAAKSCIEFCEQHGIIDSDLEKYNLSDIDVEKAHEVFVEQLGKKYISEEELLNGELGWMVKLLLENIPEEERENVFGFALKTHLYITTICMNLLHSARRFGVMPISLFMRLREQDRALWYAVASLGRRTIFVEGAGIITQFQHEITIALKSPQLHPQLAQVDAAITGLTTALTDEFAAKAPSYSLADWNMIASREVKV